MRKVLRNLAKFVVGAGVVFGMNSCNNYKPKEDISSIDSSKYYAVDSLNDVGWELMQTSSKVALFSFGQARKIAQDIDYKKGEGLSYLREGVLYKQKGEYDKSIENYNKSLKFFEEIKDSLSTGKVYNNLGLVHWNRGSYDKAVKSLLEAIKYYGERAPPEKIANTYGNLGLIFDDIGQKEKAKEYYKKDSTILRNILEKEPNNKKINSIFANVLNNMGILLVNKKGDYENYDYYKNALSSAIRGENFVSQGTILNNIALYYEDKEEYDKSKDYYKKSLNINKKIDNKKGILKNLLGLNELDFIKGDYNSALKDLKEAEKISKEIGSLRLKANVISTMAGFYNEKKDYKNSLKYYKEFMELQDSLMNNNSMKQIADMETKYKTREKEKENELLMKEGELQREKLTKRGRTIGGIAGLAGLAGLLSLISVNAYRRKKKANNLLGKQKRIIEEKNKDIMDSIMYAKKIQKSILPKDEKLERLLGDSFVLYKPKDVVSGDFYWLAEKDDKVYFSASDCTGHGVPGAFMSVLSSSLLKEAVSKKEISKPNEILDYVREGIINSLKSSGEIGGSKEGMDSVLCSIDKENKKLEFVGANNPLYLIREGELIVYKGDKMPVGYSDKAKPFTNQEIELKKNDLIYIFSDGYQDQFGGPKGKKFRPKQLKQTLLSIKDKPMKEQGQKLEEIIEDWMKNEDQIDDILVMGVKV